MGGAPASPFVVVVAALRFLKKRKAVYATEARKRSLMVRVSVFKVSTTPCYGTVFLDFCKQALVTSKTHISMTLNACFAPTLLLFLKVRPAEETTALEVRCISLARFSMKLTSRGQTSV